MPAPVRRAHKRIATFKPRKGMVVEVINGKYSGNQSPVVINKTEDQECQLLIGSRHLWFRWVELKKVGA